MESLTSPTYRIPRIWIAFAWSCIAIAWGPAAALAANPNPSFRAFASAIVFCFATFLPWALLTPTFFAVCRRFPLGEGRNARSIAALLLIGISLVPFLSGLLPLIEGLGAIALPLPIVVLGLTAALGYTPVPMDGVPPVLSYLTLFPAVIFNGVVTAVLGAGPLGEEGGWRGYLLPRLLDRLGEVPASLLLGLIWSFWHLPIMAILPEWRGGLSFGFYLPAYTVTVMGLSVLTTQIWLLARRSTLAAVWMHGVINALGGIAFSAQLWDGGWSAKANLLHFTLAIWLAALGLYLMRAIHQRR